MVIARAILAATVAAGITTASLLTLPTTGQACRTLDDGFTVCAPAASPSGAPVVTIWEDGSARYADGTEHDPDAELYVAPVIDAVNGVVAVDVSRDPSADITADMLADCLRSVGGWADPTDGREAVYVAADRYGHCAP